MYPTGTLTLNPFDITEVISDQIAGNDCNKLPTPFFKTTNNPMLMATRADGLAYLRCTLNSIMPQAVLAATKLRVGVRRMVRNGDTAVIPDPATVKTAMPAVLPATNSLDFTAVSAASDISELYQVVYGQDFDADGQLQKAETAGFFAKTPPKDAAGKDYFENKHLRDLIKVVTAAHIAYSTTQAKADRVIYNPLTDYAQHLFESFLSGNLAAVTGATLTVGEVINAVSKLGHPVGGLWDGSCNDFTHQFSFGSTNLPARDFERSGHLQRHIEGAVDFNLAAIKAATPAAYDTPVFISLPADGQLIFSLNFELNRGIEKLRLGASFGKCELTGAAMLLRLTRKDRAVGPDFVRVEWDDFTGTISDVYDFANGPEFRPRRASNVQAGYASFSVPAGNVVGKVSYTEIVLNYDPDPTLVKDYDLP